MTRYDDAHTPHEEDVMGKHHKSGCAISGTAFALLLVLTPVLAIWH